jgi:hypothetical protein
MIKYTFCKTPEMTATFIAVDGTKYVEIMRTGGDSLSISLAEFTACYGYNPKLYLADVQYESYKASKSMKIVLPAYFEIVAKAA